MFNKYLSANVISPFYRVSDYLLYCVHVLKFKEINFNDSIDYNKSRLLILDKDLLNECAKIKFYKKFEYLIFLWNGQFDYIKHKDEIKNLEKKIKKKVKIYAIGNKNLIKKNIKQFKRFYKRNDDFKIKGISILKYLLFKYPIIKSIILSSINPYLFISNFFNKKVMFIGYAEIKNLKYFASYKRKKYITNFGYNVIKRFYHISDTKNLLLKFFFNLSNNKKFIKLQIYEKFFITQCIYRHIIINIMKKFKNFKNFDNDKGLSLNSSPIYNKNYFLDLGSKVGSDKIYPRSIILKKIHQKKIIALNFFSKKDNSDIYFKNSMLKMYSFLDRINNTKKTDYSAGQLKDLLLKYFKIIN